jgi:hypothetical protein
MVNSKYLPIGSIIGKHYEIIDILGEDDFEILYLVRNNKQKETFFVIKELFLETFSSRNEDFAVLTISEAQGVFEKRKKEIILDLDEPKNRSTAVIQTFGYIQENNTIYTVMEYTNNSDVGNYLQFEPKEQIFLPVLEEFDEEAIKKKKDLSFFKLLLLPLLLALGYFSYTIFQDRITTTGTNSSQTTTHEPKVVAKEEVKTLKVETLKIETQDINESLKVKATEIPKKNLVSPVIVQVREPSDIAFLTKTDEEIVKKIESKKEEKHLAESKISKKVKVETKEVKTKEVKTKEVKTKEVKTKEVETKEVETKTIERKKPTVFNKTSVQNFLNQYINSSAKSSSKTILSNYDTPVKRYFNLKNPTHAKIRKEILKYNKKWQHRTFKIIKFKILKTYQKNKTDYCDVQTITKWKVSSKGNKKAHGKTKGMMTLKKVKNGFKISSIYTIK